MNNDVARAVAHLEQQGLTQVEFALVLGSGLGRVAQLLGMTRLAAYRDIPGWPHAALAGHQGELWHDGRGRLALCGRTHLYQNAGLDAVVFGVRVLAALGCRRLLLTNAAGALRVDLPPGSLVLLRDHLDTTWHRETSALAPCGERAGRCHDKALREQVMRAAVAEGIALQEGVYAFCRGPQYETAAEIRALADWGCDVVGMSTLPEMIEAAGLGTAVAAVSVVTNLGTGLAREVHSHETVTRQARAATQRLGRLLAGVTRSMPVKPSADV